MSCRVLSHPCVDCQLCSRSRKAASSASNVEWEYKGGEEAYKGLQSATIGSAVVDDIFGEGILLSAQGGKLKIKFGELDIKDRTNGHCYALPTRSGAAPPPSQPEPSQPEPSQPEVGLPIEWEYTGIDITRQGLQSAALGDTIFFDDKGVGVLLQFQDGTILAQFDCDSSPRSCPAAKVCQCHPPASKPATTAQVRRQAAPRRQEVGEAVTWEYTGIDSARLGPQTIHIQDRIVHDDNGEGVVLSIGGEAKLNVEFTTNPGSVGPGSVVLLVSRSLCFAVQQRKQPSGAAAHPAEPVPVPCAARGTPASNRKRKPMPASAIGSSSVKKVATNQRQLGSGGDLVAPNAKLQQIQSDQAASRKRARNPEKTAAAPSSEGGGSARPSAARTNSRDAAWSLGGYEDKDSDEESGSGDDTADPKSKRQVMNVPFRKLSPEKKKEARRQYYVASMTFTDEMREKYLNKMTWLGWDTIRGFYCKVCCDLPVIRRARDKLSHPEPCKVEVMCDKIGFRHMAKKQHIEAGGPSSSSAPTIIPVTITSEDELYCRTIRSIWHTASNHQSLSKVTNLLELQQSNGAVVSFNHSGAQAVKELLLAGHVHFQAEQRAKYDNSLMNALFPKGNPLVFMGDGSNDRSMREQEACCIRGIDVTGMPITEFLELAELDLKDSEDGKSPDASCITACYVKVMKRLEQHPGFLLHSNWKHALTFCGFDGASVMVGKSRGTAALLQNEAKQCISLHAAAHIHQLAMGDAFEMCEFYADWRATIQELFVFYNGSGKKRFSLEEVASALDSKLLKMHSVHGIRWAASSLKTIRAVATDLHVVVVDLECNAKSNLGIDLTSLSSNHLFLAKRFFQRWEHVDDPTKTARWKGTVTSVVEPEGQPITAAIFTVTWLNKTSNTMSKSELVALITEQDERLQSHPVYALRNKLVSYRFIAFTYFMYDVHVLLTLLSEKFQKNSLIISQLTRGINKSLRNLAKLKETPGQHEKAFLEELAENDAEDVLRDAQLLDGEEGRAAMLEDRVT